MSNVETRLQVTGMKCNGCINTAREALGKLPGFEDAEFNLEAGTAMVKGDIDPQAVAKTLTDAGYPAAVQGA